MTILEQCGWLALSLLGVACSAMWSGVETGCYTLNRVRLSVRASRSDPAAVRLQRSLNSPDSLLATLLVGNNISNYLGALGATAFLGGIGFAESEIVVVNTLVLTPLILVFCESLPKEVFRRAADTLTYRLAGPLEHATRLLRLVGVVPLVVWFGRIMGRLAGLSSSAELVDSRERVATLLKEGSASGAISDTQSTLIDRATQFTRAIVGDEMIPWNRVRTIALDTPPGQAAAAVVSAGHAAFPLVDRAGRLRGIARAIDVLLEPAAPLDHHRIDPVFVREETRVVEALRMLQAAGQTLAIVERQGRPVGIVTVKDLVEPLVGGVIGST
jgi:putative hemolysin